jgi:hypothetical protein
VAVFHNNLGMALERTGRSQAAEAEYIAAVNADPLYEKAALNGERIAVVLKDPGETPVDLALLAREFVNGIDGAEAPAIAARNPDTLSQASVAATDVPDSTLADSQR